jgi:hypothetical protein
MSHTIGDASTIGFKVTRHRRVIKAAVPRREAIVDDPLFVQVTIRHGSNQTRGKSCQQEQTSPHQILLNARSMSRTE